MDIIEKLKEENEALVMPDLWKMPSDQEFVQMKMLMDKKVEEFKSARDVLRSVTAPAVDDSIPF